MSKKTTLLKPTTNILGKKLLKDDGCIKIYIEYPWS
jgi:hypothetical protein